VHGDRKAVPGLKVLLLSAQQLATRRAAATALGKIGDPTAIDALLPLKPTDRFLEHAMIYALVDIDDREATARWLKQGTAVQQRAALIALDQMDHGNLSRAEVTPLLGTNDLPLQRAVIDVIVRHPEWSEEVVGVVRSLLMRSNTTSDKMRDAYRLLLAFSGNKAVQDFITKQLMNPDTPSPRTVVLLDVVRDCTLNPLPPSWLASISAALRRSDMREVVDCGLSILERHDVAALDAEVRSNKQLRATLKTTFDEQLRTLAADNKRPDDLRVRALAARGGNLELDGQEFALLTAQFNEDTPITRRLAAARAIGAAKLSVGQLQAVTKLITAVGPLELSSLLDAFEFSSQDDIGHKLIAALAVAPGLANLSASRLERVVHNFSPEIRDEAAPLLAKLQSSGEAQAERLAALESTIGGGDPRRGQAVFQGRRTSCVTCHRVQGQGGRIGPDLSTIGSRRNARDLLEAILFPSSSLARGFESFVVATTAGKVQTGLILSETKEAIQLRTTDQKEMIIRRVDIEELQPSTVSIMPKGLEQTMSPADLRDLVAYLRSLR